MLASLRKYANSRVAQLLMGLLVISFGAWGIADVFNGFRSSDIAKVGSVQITLADFQRDYTATMRAIGRQIGQDLTDEQARGAGIPQEVLGRLINQASLDNAAIRFGLGISDTLLASKIASEPGFIGPSGTFDRKYLSQVIQQMGFTENTFIVNRRQQYVRDQLSQAVAGGVEAPTTYLQAIHDYTSEERSISYLVLTAPDAGTIAAPSETDLTAYYEAHKADWDAPEVRAVSYFVLTPANVAGHEEVSDEEAKKAYDAQQDRFTKAETRDVQQIVFKDKADADAATADLASGKTFDQLMADRKMTPADVDLGVVTKDKMADPKVAEAAFGLALNAVSPVIEGTFGPSIVRVTAINPGSVTTFDQAKADIKKDVAQQKAATEIGEMHDAIEDARAGGATLAAAAAKYGLKVVTLPAVDARGNDGAGKPVTDLPAGLVAAAFQSDVGLQNDPIPTSDNGYIWYDVTGLTAPRVKPLNEVHDQVVASWKDAERGKQLDANAAALKTRLENKEAIAAVAASAGVPVKTADKLTRSSKPTDDLSADALTAAFAAQQGGVATAAGVQPLTKVVLTVDAVTVPPYPAVSPEVSQMKQQLEGQLTNDLLGTYVTDLQSKANIRYNNVALQQALGHSTSN
jgi:peptidyl-prolyl cis-trans isomerase D